VIYYFVTQWSGLENLILKNGNENLAQVSEMVCATAGQAGSGNQTGQAIVKRLADN